MPTQLYTEKLPEIPLEVISPGEPLKQLWSQDSGLIALLRQKEIVTSRPEMLRWAGTVSLAGWSSPRAFAVKMLVVAVGFIALLNWGYTRNRGDVQAEIADLRTETAAELKRQDETVDATDAEIKSVQQSKNATFNLRVSDAPLSRQDALDQLRAVKSDLRRSKLQYQRQQARAETALRAKQSASALFRSGTPLAFALALVFAAGLLREKIRRSFRRLKFAELADEHYLYLVGAEGLWLNLAVAALLTVGFSSASYGLSGMIARTGPIFWIVFFAGFYALLLYMLIKVVRGLHKALELPPPAADLSLENRALVAAHNSFWVAFGGFEIALAALSVAYYFVARLF